MAIDGEDLAPERGGAAMDSQHADALGRIVVATDFSAVAGRALEWAIGIAEEHASAVEIVHAVPKEVQTPSHRAVADRALADLVARAKASGLEARGMIREGHPCNVLLDLEREDPPGLFVVGVHGHNPWSHAYLEDEADRIIRSLGTPILDVHPTDEFRPIRTAVVGFDFSPSCQFALDTVIRLITPSRDKARIILLHGASPRSDYAIAGPSEDELARHMSEAEQRLATIADRLRSDGLHVESRVRRGYPVSVFEKEARDESADVVAVGTHAREWLAYMLLGSVAERVSHRMPCPVLASHRQEDAPTGQDERDEREQVPTW
jgi:nucleotide-binding universal stress UspA family protein